HQSFETAVARAHHQRFRGIEHAAAADSDQHIALRGTGPEIAIEIGKAVHVGIGLGAIDYRRERRAEYSFKTSGQSEVRGFRERNQRGSASAKYARQRCYAARPEGNRDRIVILPGRRGYWHRLGPSSYGSVRG